MIDIVSSLDNVNVASSSRVGGKAANLARLLCAGLPVPKGIVIHLDAFDEHGMLKVQAIHAVQQFLNDESTYAVRSSALSEDLENASWAGQFETFLNVTKKDIITKIEACHNSAKDRAFAYAIGTNVLPQFEIAVVVQEMIHPEYSGVLFTKDPITGINQAITEYIEGLGENLVSGKADPKRVILNEHASNGIPFDISQLDDLSRRVEDLFKGPQDIEWAYAENKMWLVQARPITATLIARKGYYLGEPEDLFYWGPSRAKPKYMSDFMVAIERFWRQMASEPGLPTPPKTITLYAEGKTVWLINAKKFGDFTEKTFQVYEKLHRLDKDIADWRTAKEKIPQLSGRTQEDKIVEAWFYTEFAEFALYGAETSLIKRLSRFDPETRQKIWGAFTVPDKPNFISRMDSELIAGADPKAMAKKYPWISDGYDGVHDKAASYFEKRLQIVHTEKETFNRQTLEAKRNELISSLELTENEVHSLHLARRLAEFMDDRKEWMMQTRRYITRNLGNIQYGWFFHNGSTSTINKSDAHDLWERYINFKISTSTVMGIVASNGGKHFIHGEVVIVTGPTDAVADDKIIVVPSTSPSYVPLMRKARALITDHGGMMSHAAIVAREFNLPCIVATKHATRLLHDGDRVVLDLVKGEVNR